MFGQYMALLPYATSLHAPQMVKKFATRYMVPIVRLPIFHWWSLETKLARYHRSRYRGFILNKNRRVVYIFSGPSSQITAKDTEWEAISFLTSQIESSASRNDHFTFLSDSMEAMCRFNNLKRNPISSSCVPLIDVNILRNSNFVHIRREMNSEADWLAIQGRTKKKMISGWT